MASLCKHTNGSRYIKLSPGEVPARPGKASRPKISLGKVTQKQALTAQGHVEHLCCAKKTGTAIPNPTAEWLNSLSDSLRHRLEALELVSLREATNVPSLVGWIDRYVGKREDVKPATQLTYANAKRNLEDYFASGRPLDSITAQDAQEFSSWLRSDQKLAENTARKRCSIAKQFFTAAKRARLIVENPFDGIACNVRENPSRFHFVSEHESIKILDACPDAQWRLIFSLWRWGGLRQQEVLAIRWEDVVWDRQRFVVHASKTEHHADGGIRIVPLFPELLIAFQEVFDQASPDDGPFVITRYREGQNLGSLFRKIVIRAGVKPWPKLCQNLRSTRETELFRITNGNIKAVCDWIGNSPEVAMRHYAQVTEEDFLDILEKTHQSAVAPGLQERLQGDRIGTSALPHGVETDGKMATQASNQTSTNTPHYKGIQKDAPRCEEHPMGVTGLEPVTLRV